MKKMLLILLAVLFTTTNIIAFADGGAQPELSLENGKVVVNNATENGMLIAAFYKDGILSGVKTYSGNDKIEVDVENEKGAYLADATELKAFFWDLQCIKSLCCLLTLSLSGAAKSDKITLTINGKTFMATLEDNETAAALKNLLPMTIDMSELNGNEKYYYMQPNLPSNAEWISTIHEGDIMLYGSSCLVIFYETFNTSYSYTKIGHIDDVSGLKEAVGNGNAAVTIE